MELDIPDLLHVLATRRPVFHSEADLQHEFAWLLRERHPNLNIRLEYPVVLSSRVALDILTRNGDQEMAIEMKYLCQAKEVDHHGEHFSLKAHGAQDIRRYDVWKDVRRMEQFLARRPEAKAAVLALSNDPSYWLGPMTDATCAAAFSLRDGRTAAGSLSWADHAGQGTMRGRESSIILDGTYTTTWCDYSRIEGRFGTFRFLFIPVGVA